MATNGNTYLYHQVEHGRMSTIIEYNNSQEASGFSPLAVLENGRDSPKKAMSLSPPMEHGDNSPLLNRDSENSSQGSDLDPPVGDVYNFSNGFVKVKASAAGVNPQCFNGGTALLSRDDSESDGSSPSLDSEPGLQTDYMPLEDMPLEETDVIPNCQESSSESPTAKASESQSSTLLEDERSPDEASCLTSVFTTTETSPLQLDLRSPQVGSQDISLGSQEPLHDIEQHAEASCAGNHSLVEPHEQPLPRASSLESTHSGCSDSQHPAENVATITEPACTTESLCSNAQDSEPLSKDGEPSQDGSLQLTEGGSHQESETVPAASIASVGVQPSPQEQPSRQSVEMADCQEELSKGKDGESVDVETFDGSTTATDPNSSEAESSQFLSQQLNTNKLSAELDGHMTHPNGEDQSFLQPDSPSQDESAQKTEGGSHQESETVLAVAAASIASVQPSPQEQQSVEIAEELSKNSNPTMAQEDRDEPSEPSERQASRQEVVTPPAVLGDDLGSSNLDTSIREESNLDSSNLDAGVRNASADLPVLQPLSPTHELDQQYEYLRRTLSHSRRRYSTRRRQQHSRKGDGPTKYVSPERHERLRHTESSNSSLYRDREGGQQQTRGQLRDILKTTEPVQRRDSVVERLVDQHGRRYYMDHSTHTISFEEREGWVPGTEPNMQTRREMLDRRYRSLQRSFRHTQPGRGIPRRGARELSPILSPADPNNLSLSLTPEEVISINRRSSRGQSLTQPSSKSKRQRGSSKSGKWLFFGRKSNKQISQESTSNEDDVLPISSPVTGDSFSEDFLFPGGDLDESARGARGTSVGSVGSVGSAGSEGGVVERSRSAERSGLVDVPTERRRETEEHLPRPQDASTSGTSVAEPLAGNTSAISESGDISRLIEAVLTEEGEGSTSPTLAQLGRQHSIMRATGLVETDRTAALKARHRVRATTMGSTVRHGQQAVVSDTVAEGDHDTDEETNEGLTSSLRTSTVVEPTLEKEEEEEVEKEARRSRELSPGLLDLPALKFITRKDLYTFLSSAGEAGEEFFANRALMELVQRIRADNNLFAKYQHSRHLVVALNRFADIKADLPEEWEKKLNRQGKVFFIDHSHCLTTFIDPRLPLPNQQFTYTTPTKSLPTNRRVQSFTDSEPTAIRPHHTTIMQSPSPAAPSSSAPVTTGTPLSAAAPNTQFSYEDQVVAFFRLPDVVARISQRYRRGVRPQLREIIEDIRVNGTLSLARIQLSGSVAAYELALILSLFEEEISRLQPRPVQPQVMPTVVVSDSGPSPQELNKSTLQRQKEAFSSKLQHFKVMMARLGFAQSSRLKFNIRRDHLLEDAYEHVMKSDVRHLQRKRLNITFRGEEGLDYGGPSREFFFLISREIFNPYYGLFEYSANDTYTVQISPTSSFIQNNLDWFRFAGRIISLVIAQGFLLDVFFTRTVYKSVLGRPSALKDLESLEPAFHNSLLWIQENDPEPLDLTFTVEEEAFGQLTMHELKSGGLDIPVTEENKHEYIDLMIKWRLDQGVAMQMESLRKGFSEVMPVTLLQGFDAQELEFLIAGTLEIDVDDWRNHTEYRNGYHAGHPVVQWFWQAVEMFDNEQRLRLLQFVTGTSSVPFEGFRALRGSNGPKRFCIDYFSDIKSLPRTHTCFNRIDLPPYPSFEILFEKLRIAVEEGSTFGIE